MDEQPGVLAQGFGLLLGWKFLLGCKLGPDRFGDNFVGDEPPHREKKTNDASQNGNQGESRFRTEIGEDHEFSSTPKWLNRFQKFAGREKRLSQNQEMVSADLSDRRPAKGPIRPRFMKVS